MLSRLPSLLLALLLLPIAVLSSPECEALGFTGLALCSDCQQLAAFVKDKRTVDVL